MIARLRDCLRLMGGEWVLSIVTRENPGKLIDKLKDTDVNVEIKKVSKPRTKDANAFCWALCTDIGNALTPPLPKEEVYRGAIKDVGVYQPLPIRPDAVERFCERWGERGTGWFAEIIDDVWIKGKLYKLVFAYFGTSTYNREEMARLIDHLKQDAENMGLIIPLSKAEEERMLGEWGKA